MYRQVATDLSFFRSLVPTTSKPDDWDHFVTSVEQRIAARKGRVYLDSLRNGFGATVVAPYSLRRREKESHGHPA